MAGPELHPVLALPVGVPQPEGWQEPGRGVTVKAPKINVSCVPCFGLTTETFLFYFIFSFSMVLEQ